MSPTRRPKSLKTKWFDRQSRMKVKSIPRGMLFYCPVGRMVKLSPFHGGDAGSTPAPGIVLLDDVKSHNQLIRWEQPRKKRK